MKEEERIYGEARDLVQAASTYPSLRPLAVEKIDLVADALRIRIQSELEGTPPSDSLLALVRIRNLPTGSLLELAEKVNAWRTPEEAAPDPKPDIPF